jgi:hypothetical protein
MDNPFDDMREAVRQARELNRAADAQASTLVELLDGRLRHASPYWLKRLKAQLRDFNMHTATWKDRP